MCVCVCVCVCVRACVCAPKKLRQFVPPFLVPPFLPHCNQTINAINLRTSASHIYSARKLLSLHLKMSCLTVPGYQHAQFWLHEYNFGHVFIQISMPWWRHSRWSTRFLRKLVFQHWHWHQGVNGIVMQRWKILNIRVLNIILALCHGNSLRISRILWGKSRATGGSLHKDSKAGLQFYFCVSVVKRLNKESSCVWLEAHWRLCDVPAMINVLFCISISGFW